MRYLGTKAIETTILLALTLTAGAAAAQQPPPAQPPPGFEQQYAPPAGAGQPPPPPVYAQPGAQGGVPMGPKTMAYEDGDPVPPGYHVDTRARKGLVIAGACTFGVFYLTSVLTGALAQAIAKTNDDISCIGTNCPSTHDSHDEFTPMYIPVAGPFITMGTAHAQGAGIFGLAVLGVLQAGGVAMFVAGFAAPKTELVRNDIGKIHVLPAVGKDSVGLSLVGSM